MRRKRKGYMGYRYSPSPLNITLMGLSKRNIFLLEAYKRGYRVSECGNFITYKDKNKYQKSFNKQGYPTLGIRINKKVIHITWHRLQAYQKYGNEIFEEGIIVRHYNSVKTDCSRDNILIGTQKDNAQDKPEEDRLKYSLNATDKWRKYKATEVIKFYNECKSYKETMLKFNISSKGTLHFILNDAKYS